MTADPFGTATLRRVALDAWTADPSRLRQDANLEEDHARGYYRDRVLVELAQNAADQAGHDGRLLLRLTREDAGWVLLAANSGTPLDAAGVAGMATLRASAKAGGVGRFGVGFSAVRAVSDEIGVVSATMAVRFSRSRSAGVLGAHAADHPGLAAEVARRRGDLPALRLPFTLAVGEDALSAPVPDGYTTAVRLLLRGEAEVTAVRVLLAAVDDTLLLALPALAEVAVEDDAGRRVLRDVADRWLTARASGTLPAELLAGRPVEERERPGWTLTWAVPRDGRSPLPGRLHAPTPTDEPLTLPALLLGTWPLDPSRRHVAPGPVTDHLVTRAGPLYAELAAALADDDAVLALVPTGLPAGALDAALHEAVVQALRRAAVLSEVATGDRLEPRAAQLVTGPLGQDEAVLRALAPFLGGLVRVLPTRRAAARVLDVAEREPGDVVDTLPLTAGPAELHSLYSALAPHVATEREALLGLPVPLTGGRVARGVRGAVLTSATVPAVPGLRVVDPAAAHPLLRTLGAVEADAAALLDRPELRAVAEDGRTDVVLALVAEALAEGQDVPDWLRTLPLPSADGGTEPAGELTLPGSWAARVFDGLGSVDPDVVDRWGEDVLLAVGVHAGLSVRTLADVVADPDAAEEPVEGWADYLADLAATAGEGGYVGEVAVVEHLDVVADDAWRDLLARLTTDAAARAALLTPVRTEWGTAPSYTAWWLREELGAPFGHPDRPSRLPFLHAVPEAVEGLDAEVLTALGAVRDAADLDAVGWQQYLDSWPATAAAIPLAAAAELWRGLARAARDGVALEPPARVPVLDGTTARLAVADDALVAGVGWAQVRPVVPAPETDVVAVAELLDVDVPGMVAPDVVGAVRAPVPPEVRALLPGAPASWWECEGLTVAGRPVDWWEREGELWATTTSGLARAVAQAAGRWAARYAVELLLTEPERLPELLAEGAGEP